WLKCCSIKHFHVLLPIVRWKIQSVSAIIEVKKFTRRPPMKRAYFDYAATTPLRQEVLEAMMTYLQKEYGNPSSIHDIGQHARDAVEFARKQIAEAIGATPREIIFTSGGT